MSSILNVPWLRSRRTRTALGAAFAGALVALVLLSPQFADANPDHSAGDYFIFAKAAGDGTTTDRKAFEPTCDNGSNDKQAEVSGSTSFFYGRIHSNADWANSGATNTFVDTPSPDPELTYGVNEPPTCELQANAGNYNSGGLPANITGSGVPTSVEGPYQIGEHGWPGNLGSFLNDSDGVTFGNDVTQVLPGASCHPGTSLTDTDPYTVTSADDGRVICNGTGLIKFGEQGLGSLADPFEITMISHGPIEIQDSGLTLAPVSHGVLAWTDMRFSDNATAIKLAGQGINVVRRSILFTPRSGQDVSGSDQATLCLQMIGQGALKAAGSTSHFGPLAPGCGVPASVVTEIHADRSGTGGSAHDNLGAGMSVVTAGTPIHDKVVVTSNTQPATNLTGTITVRRFNNGTCAGDAAATATFDDGNGYTAGTTVTLEDVLPFTPAVGVYSYLASYGGDDNKNMPNPGTCEGPVYVVDASVAITPASAANEAGTDHDLTVTVSVQGGAIATGGAAVTATKESGVGTLDPAACTTPAGASPQSCDVTLKSNVAGNSVVSASASIPIDVDGNGTTDITLTRATGTTTATGAASKDWVKVRISITPASAANEVGTNHPLTLKLEKATAEDANGPIWVPFAGESVSAVVTDSNGAAATFVPAGVDDCNTAADGTCIVTITSLTAGTSTIEARWAGGTVEGATVTAKASQPDAAKSWVKVRISITPATDANEVGSNHELTLKLEKATTETGGVPNWVGVAGETLTAVVTDSNGASAVFVPAGDDNCTSAADGTCTVTINSPTAGTSTTEARWAGGTIEGASITAKASDPDASKTWVKVRISITPATDANEAGSNHELTLKLEKATTETGGLPNWVGVAGETLTAVVTDSNGASAVFVPAGDDNCTSAADGTCTVTINSPTAGTSTTEARWAGGTIEGASITAKASDPDASKTWVKVRISITPATDANEAGSNHELTLKLEKATTETGGLPNWVGVAGETLTAVVTDSNGASAVFVPAGDDNCTSAADGTCTVTINSPTAGTSTTEARWAGGTIEGASITAKASDPDASKTWVKVRISITPATDANEAGSNHELTLKLEKATTETGGLPNWVGVAGETLTAVVTDSNGASAVFVPAGDDNCTSAADGTCTVTINSPTAGTSTTEARWAGGTIEGATITAKASDPDASKTWVKVRISITPAEDTNPIGTNHELTITLEQSVVEGTWTALNGETVTAEITGNAAGATATFVGSSSCVTAGAGQCIVTISSPTAGTTTVEAKWAGGTVQNAAITAKATDPDAIKHWVAPTGATLLIIDEDSLDNGIHFHSEGGGIVPAGPSFFSKPDVNDDKPSHTQRDVLRYFAANNNKTITVKTGQTGDEGWFAPTCIPQKWVSGTTSTCLGGTPRDTGIDNYFGLNGSSAIPTQSKLDKIPAVMPLRARGLVSLIGKTICAVVYDSDLSINYPSTRSPFTNGNLQGETLGIVAFEVNAVRKLNGFSSSTLPEVQLTIRSTSACGTWTLFNAPVPRSSSVPNDIDPANLAGTASNGYRQLLTWPTEQLFF